MVEDFLLRGEPMVDLIDRNTVLSHIEDTMKATEEKTDYDSGFIDGLEYCKSYIGVMPLFASGGNYEKAVRTFQKNYNLALSMEGIINPTAWALYQTWKEFDR